MLRMASPPLSWGPKEDDDEEDDMVGFLLRIRRRPPKQQRWRWSADLRPIIFYSFPHEHTFNSWISTRVRACVSVCLSFPLSPVTISKRFGLRFEPNRTANPRLNGLTSSVQVWVFFWKGSVWFGSGSVATARNRGLNGLNGLTVFLFSFFFFFFFFKF